MMRTPVDLDNERFHAWECAALLEKAAGGNKLLEPEHKDVIRPTTGDPPEAYSCTNYHTLFLGACRLLHENAGEFVHQIRGQFGFDQYSPWYEYREWIAALIRDYFPERGLGLGTLSITPMRRPAPFREEDDRGVKVTSLNPPGLDILSRKLERGWGRKILLDDCVAPFTLSTTGLPFASSAGTKDADNRWAKVLVTREVRAPRFRLPPGPASYGETWLCRAVPGRDEGRLRRGHIVAVPLHRYEGNALRVRTTPIITLTKIGARGVRCEMLAIELDAAAGGMFLSVRYGVMPWPVLLLTACAVEHISVCNALRPLAL